MGLTQRYFRSLYNRTMREAYAEAHRQILAAPGSPLRLLECGAGRLGLKPALEAKVNGRPLVHVGLDWSDRVVQNGIERAQDIRKADLNSGIPADTASFDCVCALSLVEHLLNPCRFMADAMRVLAPGGRLVLLTPNIATLFTAALIIAGRMPSSGPHPDSNALQATQELMRVNTVVRQSLEDDEPEHRHLVVFSFIVLRKYLRLIGFEQVEGRGFGWYPFPRFAQPLLERLDPYHCHQMVFSATKPRAFRSAIGHRAAHG